MGVLEVEGCRLKVFFLKFHHPTSSDSLRSSGSAPLLSRRGVFDGGNLHFNILTFNELQRHFYKRNIGATLKNGMSFCNLFTSFMLNSLGFKPQAIELNSSFNKIPYHHRSRNRTKDCRQVGYRSIRRFFKILPIRQHQTLLDRIFR